MNLKTQQRIDLYLGGFLLGVAKPIVLLAGLLLRRDHGVRPRGRVCIVKLLGGGSLLIAFPALLGLRRAYPRTSISLLTTPACVPFAELLGVFDRIDVIDPGTPASLVATSLRAVGALVGTDTVIDLEVYSRLTTILGILTLARNRISFYIEDVFWKRYLSTHLIFFNRFSGAYHFYDHVARFLGAEPAAHAECRSVFMARLPPAAPGAPRRIGIAPFCSDLGRERMLSPQQWAKVAQEHLRSGDAEVHLFGAARDSSEADRIIQALAEVAPGRRLLNRCGALSLAQAAREIAGVEEFWTVDSGLLHIARLLRVPTFSFWGPTDPATRLRPIPGIKETVAYTKVSCSPCIHVAESPPCNGNNICIQKLFDEKQELPVNPPWIVR